MKLLLVNLIAFIFIFTILAPVLTAPVEDVSEEPKLNTTEKVSVREESVTSATLKEESTDLPTEFTSFKNTSTFTCQGKMTGYYADVRLGCKVYHFCTQMDNIGETSYQRMSYICLEGSVFDQKDLNCVKKSELKVPCEKAQQEYESSNKQFDSREESSPSLSDSLAASIMMNPITRFIAGR